MTLRVLLLLLTLAPLPAHADDEDAATLERMGYTKEWLRANGYSSYQEYRNYQRQRDMQRRQQELDQQQSQRALEVEQMRLQAAEAQREAAIALEQAITSSYYFSLLPLPIRIGPVIHSRMGSIVAPAAGGVIDPRNGALSHDGNHAKTRRGAFMPANP